MGYLNFLTLREKERKGKRERERERERERIEEVTKNTEKLSCNGSKR